MPSNVASCRTQGDRPFRFFAPIVYRMHTCARSRAMLTSSVRALTCAVGPWGPAHSLEAGSWRSSILSRVRQSAYAHSRASLCATQVDQPWFHLHLAPGVLAAGWPMRDGVAVGDMPCLWPPCRGAGCRARASRHAARRQSERESGGGADPVSVVGVTTERTVANKYAHALARTQHARVTVSHSSHTVLAATATWYVLQL